MMRVIFLTLDKLMKTTYDKNWSRRLGTRYLKMKPFCDFAYEWIKMNR